MRSVIASRLRIRRIIRPPFGKSSRLGSVGIVVIFTLVSWSFRSVWLVYTFRVIPSRKSITTDFAWNVVVFMLGSWCLPRIKPLGKIGTAYETGRESIVSRVKNPIYTGWMRKTN